MTDPTLPKAFLLRRLHSLSGLFIALFLIVHLFTNSQIALLAQDPHSGFVKAVNDIHNLPFLPVIEIFLLAVPILLHAALGIQYLWTGQINSFHSDGKEPSLSYPRNQAYTWQRITSWVLLVAILLHVAQMRFINTPEKNESDHLSGYSVKITSDNALYPLADKLGVLLEKNPHIPEQLIARAPDFGTATLLLVRDTFKSPLMITLYTLFVLAAVFHAFNGLWTFMITWGITLTAASQRYMGYFSIFLMLLVAFLGLSAIFGSYFFNSQS